VHAIDEEGRLAGELVVGGVSKAFVFDGAIRVIPTADGLVPMAMAIRNGVVVGFTRKYDPTARDSDGQPLRPPEAFAFRDGRLIELGPGVAYSVNAQGQVLLGQRLWDGSFRPVGAPDFFGMGLNDAGAIAGEGGVGSGSSHAAVLDGGAVRDLGVLPGGGTSMAMGITASGAVVGWSEVGVGGRHLDRHGFVFTDGRMIDAGALLAQGTAWGALLGMNGAGQAVGTDGSLGYSHGVLWERGKLADLNQLVDAPEWFLTSAQGINERGQIAATGFRLDAPTGYRALRLTPH